MKILILHLITILLVSGTTFAQEYEPTDLIIDGIECTGNTLTDCEIIKREIYVSSGDHLDEEEIKNSKIRLQLLGLFNSVNLSLKKSLEKGRVILVVDVEEDSPYFSEMLIENYRTTSRAININADFKLGHRNLFGKGKILQFTLSPDGLFTDNNTDVKRYGAGLEYIDPHLFGQKNYFMSVNYSHSWAFQAEETKYLLTNGESSNYGLNLGRRIFDFSHIGVGIKYSTGEQLQRETVNDSFITRDTEGVGYTLNYGWNSQDDMYFATEGSKLDITHALYKDSDFKLTTLDFQKNYSINEKHVLTAQWETDYFDFGRFDDLQYEAGLKWSYQIRRGAKEKNISDIRVFIDQGARKYSDIDGVALGSSAGILLDTKSLGIVKITTYWWSN